MGTLLVCILRMHCIGILIVYNLYVCPKITLHWNIACIQFVCPKITLHWNIACIQFVSVS